MKKKILIVDDDLDLCHAVQTHLELLGYDSILAVNGKEAVDLATSQVPDLILMDLLLLQFPPKRSQMKKKTR